MNRKAGLLGLVAMIAALSGCGATKTTSSSGTLTTDQQDVQTTVASDPAVVDDGLFDASDPTGYSAHGASGPLTGIGDGNDVPAPGVVGAQAERRFWRTITGVTRSADIEVTRDEQGLPVSAHVTIHKHFTGTFNVVTPQVVAGVGGDSVVVHHVSKPLKDHWVRQLWLVHTAPRDSSEGRGRWHIVATSGIEITSEVNDPDGPQPHIVSIRVQTAGLDTTLTDPAAAIPFHDLCRVPSGTPVTVTVTTQAADDFVVLMHHDGRFRLTANGDDTYSGTWDTSNFAGLKHVGVNALANGTVTNDNVAYHSHAWVFPYLNDGDVIADETP